jgi:hypothetical protein
MERVLFPTERHKEGTDDLKQIRGIGPVMEQRLNQAGIFTFCQLANTSTEDLAALFSDKPGLSAERITEKDWPNQARLLMEKEAIKDDPPSEDKGQYSAVFSVDLLLDSQNRVRRTHILHVQSRKEDSWADWNKDRLTDFIFENATIRFEQKSLRQDKKPAEIKQLVGDLNITEMEIQASSGKVMHREVAANEPFEIELMLNTAKTSASAGTPLQYQTEIYAKNLSDGKRQNIGENKGIIESKDLIPIVVNCHSLPQGSYRLEACVVLSQDMENLNPKSRLVAMTEGKLFRVN